MTDRIKNLRSKLTEKQARFAEIFVDNPQLSKAEVYRRAGYKAKDAITASVCAGQNLKKPLVAEYIDALREPIDKERFASREKKREILYSVMTGAVDGTKPSDRLQAITIDNLMMGHNKPIQLEGELTLTAILAQVRPASGLPKPVERVEDEVHAQ